LQAGDTLNYTEQGEFMSIADPRSPIAQPDVYTITADSQIDRTTVSGGFLGNDKESADGLSGDAAVFLV
jgi:phage gp45-like